jgi:Na+/H+-dicarboxylate symporter
MAKSVRGFKDASDRWIYWSAAVAICVVVVLGFAESYFLRPFLAHADSLTTLVHVHGALMTAWIALFIAQTMLVAIGHRGLHRRLGTLGMVLVALIFVVSHRSNSTVAALRRSARANLSRGDAEVSEGEPAQEKHQRR